MNRLRKRRRMNFRSICSTRYSITSFSETLREITVIHIPTVRKSKSHLPSCYNALRPDTISLHKREIGEMPSGGVLPLQILFQAASFLLSSFRSREQGMRQCGLGGGGGGLLRWEGGDSTQQCACAVSSCDAGRVCFF